MKSTATKRGSGLRATAVSLVTLLALLVVPACSPLCAAQACLQAQTSTASETHCHLEMTGRNDASQIHVVQNCTASELPMATLSAGANSDVPQISRSASRGTSHLTVSQEFDSKLIANGNNFCAKPDPLRPSDSFPAMGVLRI
jgi:hypothetical protein